jgi:hypothetical protein
MTVLATFEIGTSGSPSPDQNKGMGAAQIAGRAGAVGQSFFPAIAPGAESFRAGWQSLLASLASLASHGEGLSEAGAEADRVNSFAGPAPQEPTGNKAAATSALAPSVSLRTGQGTQKRSEQVGATPLSPVVARSGTLAVQMASGAPQQGSTKRDSTKTAERKPATEPDGKTAGVNRVAHSLNFMKPEIVSAVAIQGVAPAANASVAQILPAAEILSAASVSADVKEDFSRPGLAIDLPTAASTALLKAPASLPELTGVVGAAKSGPRESVEESGTTAQQRAIPPVPSPSWSYGPPPNTRESPQKVDEADWPAAGENLNQTMPSSQSPAQAEAPEQPPDQVAATSQSSTQRLIAAKNQNRVLMDTQNVTPPPASSPNPALAGPSGQTPMQTEARSENSIQRIAQNPNEVPMQPVRQATSVSRASTGNVQLDSLPAAVHAAALSNQPSVPPPTVNKHGPAVSGKISTSNTSRPTRESGNLDAVVPGGRVIERQLLGPAMNVAAMRGDLASAQGGTGNAGEPGGGSASTATGPDSRETFATLDAASATGRPILIHAAPQRAEAGFRDPALGWVGVRADTSGGVVHAEVVPGSADAAQALGSHLAGLNAYLAEHHTPVETLTLSAPEGEGAGLGSGQSAGQSSEQGMQQGMQQGTGQRTGQEPAPGADSGSTSGAAENATVLPSAATELTRFFGGLEGSTPAGRPGGVHISVMA